LLIRWSLKIILRSNWFLLMIFQLNTISPGNQTSSQIPAGLVHLSGVSFQLSEPIHSDYIYPMLIYHLSGHLMVSGSEGHNLLSGVSPNVVPRVFICAPLYLCTRLQFSHFNRTKSCFLWHLIKLVV